MSTTRFRTTTSVAATSTVPMMIGRSSLLRDCSASRPMPSISKICSVIRVPGQQRGHVQAEDRDDRAERGAQGVAVDDPPLGDALRARRPHVVLGRASRPWRRGRSACSRWTVARPSMIHGASRPAAQASGPAVVNGCVGAAGKDRVEDHEVQREQQRQDVVRDRAEHLGETDDGAVQPRPSSTGAVDAGADADREEHDHRAERQRQRGREPGEDLALDLTVGAERVAQAGRRALLGETAVDDRRARRRRP